MSDIYVLIFIAIAGGGISLLLLLCMWSAMDTERRIIEQFMRPSDHQPR